MKLGPSVKRQLGVTLIELMITTAIMAAMSLVSMAFGTGWVTENRLIEAENQLVVAFDKAKSTALRNRYGKVGGSAASTVCLSNQIISVHEATSAAAASCATTAIWQADLHERISVSAGGTSLSCLCVTSKAELTATGCGSCATTTSLNLTMGNDNVSISLL